MKIRTEFPHTVTRHEDLGIPLPDGTRLSARLWLPDSANETAVPTILEYLPYRKRDGTVARDCLTHPWFAGHGYAALRVDMRGSGDSEGLLEDEYTEQELQDACDVIAWVRAQPWSSGKLGMMGISWGGFNGLQVAALAPEGLDAVVTLCSTVDRYADDIHYKGGCLLGENLGWASQMLTYSARPPDPLIVGNRWRDIWLERLESQPFLLVPWLRHQRRDAYWEHGSVCEDYGSIKAAVQSWGGWHDGYRNTISHLVTNLEAPVKGIVGPWIHKYPHFAAPQPAIGFLQEAKRWWDRWLKGEETGVENDPDMRVWIMDSVRPKAWLPERPGRWASEAEWPSQSIAPETYFLTDDGLRLEMGKLSATVTSPADCGSATGEYFPFAFGPEFPIEQRVDDALSLCVDGDVAPESKDIVGAPRVALKLASDKAYGQIAVRLCDVFPDGTSALITHGFLNLTHHASHADPQALKPGELIDVAFDLDQIAYRLPAGHRLRVAISTNYWPFLWPSPGPVSLTINDSKIDIPTRALAETDEWQPPEPECATPWAHEEIAPGACTRHREIDLETGASVLTIVNRDPTTRDLEHGVVTAAECVEKWSILPDDPLSARGESRWTSSMSREGWETRTVCDSALTSDETTFYATARIRAWEGEKLMFDRSFDEAIPRDHV